MITSVHESQQRQHQSQEDYETQKGRGRVAAHRDRRIGTLTAAVSELSRSGRIEKFLRIIPVELGEGRHPNAHFGQTRRSLAEKTESSEPGRRDIVLDELAERGINGILVLQ